MALTKRADPAELKTIFLKVSIKESVLFLICVLQLLKIIFKQLSILLLHFKKHPQKYLYLRLVKETLYNFISVFQNVSRTCRRLSVLAAWFTFHFVVSHDVQYRLATHLPFQDCPVQQMILKLSILSVKLFVNTFCHPSFIRNGLPWALLSRTLLLLPSSYHLTSAVVPLRRPQYEYQ